MKILGVFRDIVPARMAARIYKEVLQQGIEFSIIAEGRAVSVFKEAGIPLCDEGDDTLSPFQRVIGVFEDQKPNILCIGTSYPLNWEREFAYCARARMIPVVAISDIWGAEARLETFTPDIALVIDEWEVRRLQRKGINAYAIGDIASLTQTEAPQDTDAVEHFERLHETYYTVLLVGDDKDVIVEQASLTAQCIRQEVCPDFFVIIPRLVHPKQMADPDVERKVREALTKLEGLIVDPCLKWSTDALAAHCDYVCACFTTPLRIAVHHGKRALSLHGPLCRALLKEETGFDTFPLVENGVIVPVTIPLAFSSFDWTFLEDKARAWAHSTLFRPEVAVRVFQSIAT